MQVEAAQARRVQHRRQQDLAIGHHHRRIEVQGPEPGNGVRVPHGLRRAHLKAPGLGKGLDRGGLQHLAAPAGGRGLGIDGHHLVTRIEQGPQALHGEVRCAHEGKAQGGHGHLVTGSATGAPQSRE